MMPNFNVAVELRSETNDMLPPITIHMVLKTRSAVWFSAELYSSRLHLDSMYMELTPCITNHPLHDKTIAQQITEKI